MSKRLIMATAFLVVPFAALTAQAQTQPITTLPANLQADRNAIELDEVQIQTFLDKIRTDAAAGNASALAADRTALRIAQMKLEADVAKLRQDASVALQGDTTELTQALTQLQSDQAAGNASGAALDQTAVNLADQTLAANRQLIFGGLGGLGTGIPAISASCF